MKYNLIVIVLLIFSISYSDNLQYDSTGADSSQSKGSSGYPLPQFPFRGFTDPFFNDPFFNFKSPFDSTYSFSFSGSFSNTLNMDVQDEKVVVTAYIPGSSNSKIDVKVENNTITVKGEMKKENIVKDSSGNVISSSTQINNFNNSQPVPVDVDPTIKNMNYQNDTLTIELLRKSQ
jgi:HSP20 family protein